jgi:hypothetical protein
MLRYEVPRQLINKIAFVSELTYQFSGIARFTFVVLITSRYNR